MSLAYDFVQKLQRAEPSEAWEAILDHAWSICSQPISEGKAEAEVARRDRAIADTDLYLATAGWDLWSVYEATAPPYIERVGAVVECPVERPRNTDPRRSVIEGSTLAIGRSGSAWLHHSYRQANLC